MEKRSYGEAGRTIVPTCSISEDSGFVTVKVEMPGVAKDGLEVKVEGNELSISGERQSGWQDGRYLLRERRAGAYRKVFTLDDTIDHDKVEAAIEGGVLTLKLQVKEAAKPRRIEIA